MFNAYINPCTRCNNRLPWQGNMSLCTKCEQIIVQYEPAFYTVINEDLVPDVRILKELEEKKTITSLEYSRLDSQLQHQYQKESEIYRTKINYLKSLGWFHKLFFKILVSKSVPECIQEFEKICNNIKCNIYDSQRNNLETLHDNIIVIEQRIRDFHIGTTPILLYKQWKYRNNLVGFNLIKRTSLIVNESDQPYRQDFEFKLFGDVSKYAENHSNFVRRKRDYKRGNSIDNFIRNNWKVVLYDLQNGKCLQCGVSADLQLDHFWLPKNEGGNFAMYHKPTNHLISNVILLCPTCNAGKGDMDVRKYLTKINSTSRKKLVNVQIENSLKMMLNDQLMGIAAKWYAKKVHSLASIAECQDDVNAKLY